LSRLSAEELMEPTLTDEQRDTLKRSRSQRLPTLNIRHLRRTEALTQVEVFVRTARVDGHRFVRVIHGKGRQSAGEPVLKRAVIEWSDGPGGLVVRRWAPETDRSGGFGCIVLELRLAGR
jgi:DNA-nicking Smr family endonuclease